MSKISTALIILREFASSKGGKENKGSHAVMFGKAMVNGLPKSYTLEDGRNFEFPHFSYWKRMVERCYCDKLHTRYPTYADCVVCDEWLKFEEFVVWFDGKFIDGFHLDKDIINPGNKIYSPENCIMVSCELNNLFTNNSKSGDLPIGVKISQSGKRYTAKISFNGKNKSLGTYDTVNDAAIAYIREKISIATQMLEKHKNISNEIKRAIIKNNEEKLYSDLSRRDSLPRGLEPMRKP